LITLLANRDWLDEATETISQFWRRKNAQRHGLIIEKQAVAAVRIREDWLASKAIYRTNGLMKAALFLAILAPVNINGPMANTHITRITRWTRVRPFLFLTIVAMTTVLIGCKTTSQSGIGDEQKQLIALSKTIPTNSSPNEVIALDAGLDSQTKTVRELVEIFMANRDWTEFMQKKELDAWQRTHPYNSPPVIIHEKQMDAAYQLTQLGSQAKAAAPAMAQSLTNSGFLTHQWALHQGGVDAATEERADFENRHWAIQVLQAIGSVSPEVVPALVLGLDDPKTGYEAANALVIISQTDTNVLSAVIAKLESDPESPEAENSVRVLNGIGADARAAVPLLIQLLEHTNACDMVVNTFGKIGSEAGTAVPALLHLYGQSQGDGNFAKRRQIIIVLGKIGPPAKEAVPMLLGLCNRPYVFFYAVHALWQIDRQYTQLAISTACGILRAKATPDRNNAIGLLGEIGPPAQSSVPLLLDAMNSQFGEAIPFNAAWALWRIDPSQKANVIAKFESIRTHGERSPYEDLSVDASGALWQIQPERRDELCPAVIAMLKESKGVPRGYARYEMQTLLPALIDIKDNPKYAELRPWAIRAINEINGLGSEWQQR
jgi:HEAT repeat protein